MSSFAISPFPLDEQKILRFIAFLASQNLASSTISNYLAGIRAWALALGGADPDLWTPRVRLAVKAVSRIDSPPRQVEPITFPLLCKIFSLLYFNHENLMLASALSLHYFACLRASELCLNPVTGWAPLRSSVQFPAPDRMVYSVPSSKNAPKGFVAHIGCSGHPICATCVIRYYLRSFPATPSDYLFPINGSAPLDYPSYNNYFKNLIKALGLDHRRYSTHSLRAGAATQAAHAGMSQNDIQRLGRWRSDAYKAYLRPPPSSYASLAPHLVSHK